MKKFVTGEEHQYEVMENCRVMVSSAADAAVYRPWRSTPTGSRRDRIFTALCLSVFPGDISKSDLARIAKLDTQMFHDESCKAVYFGFRRSKVTMSVSVFRQYAILMLAAYISHAGFSPVWFFALL